MLRVTDDLIEVRHWAEHLGGQPCRQPDGRPSLCFGSDPAPALAVGWDEFEIAFLLAHCVLVYDDAPGCIRCFVGSERDARAYVAAADPRTTGVAP